MKKVTLTIVSVMLGALIASGAQATVPELIPVQGVLTDGVGDFIDGSTNMVFRLYDSETASSAIYTETLTGGDAPDVDEGFFTVYLGAVTAIDPATLAAASELWLGVTVGTDSEMNRTQLGAVPFALEAQNCQQIGSLTESDIFSSESDLTTLLDDNYSPVAHNHDAAYAPISHTHAWTDLTAVPAGFADGIDDEGFSTEGELTTLLNDNYAPLAHGHVAAYQTDTVTTGVTITSGTNYRMDASVVNLANGGQCIVTATAVISSLDSGDTVSGPYLRTARQVGTAAPTYDGEYGGYLVYPGSGSYAVAPSATYVYNMTAGTNYQFGCAMLSPPANWVGDSFYCRVSWLCLEE